MQVADGICDLSEMPRPPTSCWPNFCLRDLVPAFLLFQPNAGPGTGEAWGVAPAEARLAACIHPAI